MSDIYSAHGPGLGPTPPSSPFVGHLLWIVRTIPYREPDYEEWSDDGAIPYECVAHLGDFLKLVQPDTGETVWVALGTIAEIRLECENACPCDDPDDGPPISFTLGDTPPPGDPSLN